MTLYLAKRRRSIWGRFPVGAYGTELRLCFKEGLGVVVVS